MINRDNDYLVCNGSYFEDMADKKGRTSEHHYIDYVITPVSATFHLLKDKKEVREMINLYKKYDGTEYSLYIYNLDTHSFVSEKDF